MRAVVIAGGDITDPSFLKTYLRIDDFIICADSGYQNALRLEAVPDVVIGDFDSFDEKLAIAPEKIKLPVEKDETDAFASISFAIEHGYKDILFLGAIGSRLDHSLANIQILEYGLQKKVQITIVNEHNEMFLINQKAIIPKKEGYMLSLLPLTDVTGVKTKGLYYALDGAVMKIGNPYGVSNIFVADKAEVSIESGQLLVISSKD